MFTSRGKLEVKVLYTNISLARACLSGLWLDCACLFQVS